MNEIVTVGHVSFSHLIKYEIVEIDNPTVTFTFVRDPFDRFISLYAYFRRRRWTKLEFEPFCEWFEFQSIPPVGLYNRRGYSQWNCQSDWVPDDIDFIGRFENLPADFRILCNFIGLPAGRLPRKNVSGNRDNIHHTKKTKNIVYKLYKKDFERFNY